MLWEKYSFSHAAHSPIVKNLLENRQVGRHAAFTRPLLNSCLLSVLHLYFPSLSSDGLVNFSLLQICKFSFLALLNGFKKKKTDLRDPG